MGAGEMQQTMITFPDDLLRRAERKASSEGLSVPEVLKRLLTQWLSGAEDSKERATAQQSTIERAFSSRGMWSDRDPDDFLRQSREGLIDRDRELRDARLDAR